MWKRKADLDLKEPAGWRFSSLRKILLGISERDVRALRGQVSTNHPAALESAADSIKGVSTQGFFISDIVDKEPIVKLPLEWSSLCECS